MTQPKPINLPVHEFDPQPLRGQSPFPPTWLDTILPPILARGAGREFSNTGVTRESYLDSAERLVRPFVSCQDDRGALIDPVTKAEWGQTSPRFVASIAVLLHFGRCEDLRQHAYLGMDYCCAQLASGKSHSPDFWLRELMTAWFILAPIAPAERVARWEANLRSIDPESINWHIARDGKTPADLHNWTIYAAAGEAMRHVAGLSPTGNPLPGSRETSTAARTGKSNPSPDISPTSPPPNLPAGSPATSVRGPWGPAFYEKYIPSQFNHFNNEGMYRDPNDPMTYDMTTRLQFATPLAYGFETPLRPAIEELLRRGGLAQLLYVSPEGFAPFGGRSSQFHGQESILAAVGELEARRYRTSNPQLAGAFKRQARLSAKSIRRWLEMSPHRHLKNGFPPENLHGCESYALYSVYSLFAASCLGLAALYADESIAEAPVPAEIGGYVVEFSPAFHKIFATCGGTQIEVDTAAHFHYDATGLGRFHRAGVPIELGLAGPIAAEPKFNIPDALKPDQPTAIAPAWQNPDGQWIHLAALSDALSCELKTDHADTQVITFGLTWTHAATQTTVQQQYTLVDGELTIRSAVQIAGERVTNLRMIVPLLETDGTSKSTIDVIDGRATVNYLRHLYEVEFPAGSPATLGRPIANRNGIYRPLTIDSATGEIVVTLRLE